MYIFLNGLISFHFRQGFLLSIRGRSLKPSKDVNFALLLLDAPAASFLEVLLMMMLPKNPKG